MNFKRIYTQARHRIIGNLSSSDYWNRYTVGGNQKFRTVEESLAYQNWLMGQYLFYKRVYFPKLIFNGKTVLDHGCGVGNDIVAINSWSTPDKIVGVDISEKALGIAEDRIELHNWDNVGVVSIDEGELPFDDGTFDCGISSGVLHHIPDFQETLKEIYRILKPGGWLRTVVYNYESIYLQLYIPYVYQIVEGMYSDKSVKEAFRLSSEHGMSPCSYCFTREEFAEIARGVGFHTSPLENSISVSELGWLSNVYNALKCDELEEDHKKFLRELNYDQFGFPMHNGDIAGINLTMDLFKPR